MDGLTSKSIRKTVTKGLADLKGALVKGFGPDGPSAPDLLGSGKIFIYGVLRKLRDETHIRAASWRLVFAIVDEERLYYYEDETSTQPLGTIALRGCNQVRQTENSNGASHSFAICRPAVHGRSREYTFATLTAEQKTGWMKKVKDAMILVNREKVNPSLVQQVVSKSMESRPRQRLPSPPVCASENEINDIEEPLYQDLDSGDSADAENEHDDSEDTDGDDDKTDYLPPTSSPGSLVDGTASWTSDIKQGTSSLSKTVVTGGVSVFPPGSKPVVSPKPPISKVSTLPPRETQTTPDTRSGGLKDAGNTFPRSKTLPKALIPAKDTSAPRFFWNGEADEAMSALKECSERGTYLIRNSKSEELSLTLVVYVDDRRLRKIKLCQSPRTDDEPTKWYAKQVHSGQGFSSLEDLVKHFSTTPLDLNETHVMLTKPLQHHMMVSTVPRH